MASSVRKLCFNAQQFVFELVRVLGTSQKIGEPNQWMISNP